MSKPNIPALSPKVDPEVKKAFAALKTWFERTGNIISASDLAATGMFRTSQDGSLAPVAPYLDSTPPSKITGLTASGAFNSIMLTWDDPRYRNLSFVEVYRAEVDDLSQAVRIGTTQSTMYVDVPANSSLSATYFYWIRMVSFASVPGPFNSTAGTPGSTADDPAYLLELLTDRITPGQLHTDLGSRIARIDPALDSFGEGVLASIVAGEAERRRNAAFIVEEQTVRASEVGAVAETVTTLQTTVDGNTASIETQQQSIDGIEAEYTIKTDVNGVVAGIGLINGPKGSEFGVRAGKFFVVDPAAPETQVLPFIVADGKVYIDTALIKNASIKNAMIENLTADKLTVPGTASIWDAIITLGKITNAYIGDFIESEGYTPGSAGWHINKDGSAEFHNIYARGNIEASSLGAYQAVNTANIVDAAVDTLKLAGQAVTIPVSWWLASAVTITPLNTEVGIASLTSIVFDTPGQLLVNFSAGVKGSLSGTSGGSAALEFVLYIDGVKEQEFLAASADPVQSGINYYGSLGGSSAFSYSKAVGVGTHSVEVKAVKTTGGNWAISCETRSLVLQGAKR